MLQGPSRPLPYQPQVQQQPGGGGGVNAEWQHSQGMQQCMPEHERRHHAHDEQVQIVELDMAAQMSDLAQSRGAITGAAGNKTGKAAAVQASFYDAKSGTTKTFTAPAGKAHKRTGQINFLAQDCMARQGEFDERRSSGFQTKSQTQAKYGW